MYLIASNGFASEYINDQEGNVESGKGYLGRHKRIRGKKKGGNRLVEMEKHLCEIEHDLAIICKQKGHIAFNAEVKLVTSKLISSDKSRSKRIPKQ